MPGQAVRKRVHEQLFATYPTKFQVRDYDFAQKKVAVKLAISLEEGHENQSVVRLELSAAIEQYLTAKKEMGLTSVTISNDRRILTCNYSGAYK
jgi:hypothetical protein